MALRACLVLLCVCACAAAVDRLRGVDTAKAHLYTTVHHTWKCLSDDIHIRPNQINDDVCDCPDGTDEPGTSACTGGQFFCVNSGHQSSILPASRVDDSVCDCCDGSDELNISCPNTCEELGRKAREELERTRELRRQGYQRRQELMQEGTTKRASRNERQATLNGELETKKATEAAQKAVVDQAEGPEREAKEKFDKDWEEQSANKRAAHVDEVFARLDADKDGLVSTDDVMHLVEADSDADGTITLEEAETVLDIDGDGALNETEAKVARADFQALYDNLPENIKGTSDLQKPDYPEDVKSLIAVADKAREEHRQASDAVGSIERELAAIAKDLAVDDGPHHEWGSLLGQCIESNEREYKYRMCFFDKVTQEPLHGGRSTSLGSWKEWSGKPYKYSEMLFDNGERCWNGPSRSIRVFVTCGAENKIDNVEEPNRCEYTMHLATPAACEPPGHDEL